MSLSYMPDRLLPWTFSYQATTKLTTPATADWALAALKKCTPLCDSRRRQSHCIVSARITSASPHFETVVCSIVCDEARYMNEDLLGRIEAFLTRVTAVGAVRLGLITLAKSLDASPDCELQDFFVANLFLIFSLGRVRVELDDNSKSVMGGLINDESVLLESFDGHCEKLDFSSLKMESIPVFLKPGMVFVI